MISAALLLIAAQAAAAPSPAASAAPSPRPTPAGPVVVLETSQGRIRIGLYEDKSPLSTANFLRYVKKGHYDGTVFHRVMPGFMIQGGGMTPNMAQKQTRAPVPIESKNGLKNDAGTLAMARTSDPNSATAQFFINVKNNDFLNYSGESPDGWGYAVFGKVVEGKEVVDKIKKVATGNAGGHQNVPTQAVVIEKAERA